MLPELGGTFGVSAGDAAVSVTAYLLPFAGLMLVSGTLGERWGRRRTVVVAYAVYVLASLACALAPTFALFLGARAVQGAANAFTTPLLLAALAGTVAPQVLGRALGWFGALQAAGQTSAPLVGGAAAELDWRWAFLAIAVVSALLAAAGIPAGGPRPDRPPQLRSAWHAATWRAGVVAAVGWGCLAGLSFLVALRLQDDFGLSAGARGLVLTGLGVVGMITARFVGSRIDRTGPRRAILAGTALGVLVLAGVALAPTFWLVAAVWAVAGVATQLVLVGVNALVLGGPGANRGGAMSVVQAVRFGGGALAPVAFTPLYHAAPLASFAVAAVALAVLVPVALGRA
jgi:MFS family permease